MENDQDGINRKKIVRILDFNVLVWNVNTIYENFIDMH